MKDYTRIKHSVLMDIFAKGRLSKREMQVAIVVIRESWGWDKGTSNWTKKPLTHEFIAEKTGMDRRHITPLINQMVKEKKLLIDDDKKYSFNEHLDTWIILPQCTKMVPSSENDGTKKVQSDVPKRYDPMYQNGTSECTKMVQCRWWGFDVTVLKLKEIRKRLGVSKEIFKEIFKETLKEKILYLRLFYETTLNSKLRTFDETRQRMIENRLENFSLQELMQVVTNISESDWHMGRDPESDGKSYHSWELLFRSDKQIEKYLSWTESKQKGVSGGKGRTDPSTKDKFRSTGITEIPAPRG